MDRDTELSLIERVHAHLEAKTTDCDPEPSRVDVERYFDADRFERERAALFLQRPTAIGHGAMIPEAGDFFTHDALGLPLLVVRDTQGNIGAFLNVCRHRGTRVVGDARGCGRKAFTCPYHAWTYNTSGQLVGVPHPDGFPGLDRATRGLVRVPATEAAGLILVAPRGTAPIDGAAELGALHADFLGLGLDTQCVYDHQTAVRELNWKLNVDIFLETYHLRCTHADSIYPLFFDNVGLVDRLGNHQRNVFPKRTIRDLTPDRRDAWRLREHANILYHLFPNTFVLVQPDHTAVLHLSPLCPDETRVDSYTLVPEVPGDKAARYWDANNAILRGATDEDFERGESIQRGVQAGANEHLTFARYEHSLAHFHARVDALLKPATVSE